MATTRKYISSDYFLIAPCQIVPLYFIQSLPQGHWSSEEFNTRMLDLKFVFSKRLHVPNANAEAINCQQNTTGSITRWLETKKTRNE